MRVRVRRLRDDEQVNVGAVGWWPLAEAHSVDALQNKKPLPPRTALPVLRVLVVDSTPSVPDNFPHDKYDLEPCELAEHVRRELPPAACWPCVIAGSGVRSGRRAVGECCTYDALACCVLVADGARSRCRPTTRPRCVWR
jgi:hypothetical protein